MTVPLNIYLNKNTLIDTDPLPSPERGGCRLSGRRGIRIRFYIYCLPIYRTCNPYPRKIARALSTCLGSGGCVSVSV